MRKLKHDEHRNGCQKNAYDQHVDHAIAFNGSASGDGCDVALI